MKMARGFVLLMLAEGLAGCGGFGSLPVPSAPSVSAPAPIPKPTPNDLVVFTDRVSGLSTSDVHDVQEQIVHFNWASELIWAVYDTRYPGYPVMLGEYIKADLSFQIRFGTKNGERRAYLAPHDTNLICDVEIVDGQPVITMTTMPVPGT